jgi:prophage regulatory protein
VSQKLLSYKDLKERGVTKLSLLQLSRYEDAGEFPRRIRLSHKSIAWVENEINAWLEERLANRETEAAAQRAKRQAITAKMLATRQANQAA